MKMNRAVSFIFCLPILLVIGCNGTKDTSAEDARDLFSYGGKNKYDISGDFKVIDASSDGGDIKYAKVSEFLAIEKIVKLGKPEEVAIGEVSKVLVSGSDFFILDARVNPGVYRFDSSGAFVSKYGAKGEGPGEYDEPLDFCIADSHLVLLDRQMRLFRYKISDASYLGYKKLPFFAGQVFYNGQGILGLTTNHSISSEKDRNHIIFFKW